jgi:hypothetical protein
MKVICSTECDLPELLELPDYDNYTCCGYCDFLNKCIENKSKHLCSYIKHKKYDANTCIQCESACYE